MSTHLQLKLNQADLERMARLAQRRGLNDLTTYIRQLMEADAERQLPELAAERLRAAGLLVEDWDDLDAEIAVLEASGVQPANHPVLLPENASPSEVLIGEDRGDY